MMVQEARKSGGAKWVRSHMQANGGASGGTVSSLLNVVAKVPLKTIRDPHLLDTPGVRSCPPIPVMKLDLTNHTA